VTPVKEDQPVVVVETDKSQIEIPAPVTGIVKSLGAKVGDVLAVGSNLMQIEATGAISKDIAAHASAPAVRSETNFNFSSNTCSRYKRSPTC
jgi:pyruvate/2-oxoglutarate dehydrogenase complex dihydrolipoamide acyltransferase (E2) component